MTKCKKKKSIPKCSVCGAEQGDPCIIMTHQVREQESQRNRAEYRRNETPINTSWGYLYPSEIYY